MRSGARLGVVLNTESPSAAYLHPLICFIVEVDVCDIDELSKRFLIDTEVVVLTGDFNCSCFQSFDWMIATMMTKRQLVGFCT